jgi:Fur family iron response transcriptional regulator
MASCPVHVLRARLRKAELRPTRQRVALGWLLFSKGDRHVTAEQIHAEARRAKLPASLATVYNTLRQFNDAGLLKEIRVEGVKAFYDTNPTPHHHFLIEDTGELVDIAAGGLALTDLPQPPEGCEIAGVEVVVRVRRASGAGR